MSPNDPSFWQVIAWIGSLIGIISTAFVAGYNWRRITVTEKQLEQHLEWAQETVTREREVIATTYARRDLVDLELKAIKSRLDYIGKQVNEIWERRSTPRDKDGR